MARSTDLRCEPDGTDWRLPAAITLAALAGAGAMTLRASVRRRRHFDLRGSVALITGGSRGLGLVLARHLADLGARVAICARDEDELARAEGELLARGAEVLALPCDVTDPGQVRDLVREVSDRLDPIDVLINNAGIIAIGPAETMTLQDYRDAMNTHFWASLYCIEAVLPRMKDRRRGRIVNIASIGGKLGVPHMAPYTASKFAQAGLSEALRTELLRLGIYVTTVCPAPMRTGSALRAHFKGRHRSEFAWFSLAASLPFTSIDADGAARRIVRALEFGEPEITLTLPGRLAARLHGVSPGLFQEAMALVNYLLPGPGGIGQSRATGAQSESMVSRSVLTRPMRRAAERHNELAEPAV